MNEPTFRHTPEMGEISGFGGGYENACQDMLEAGVKWLRQRVEVDLKGKEYEGVFGVFKPDSDDAAELSEVVGEAVPDCTGAMHHAVMQRLFYIAKHGWDGYVAKVLENKAKEGD